jgi:hypothetical protein
MMKVIVDDQYISLAECLFLCLILKLDKFRCLQKLGCQKNVKDDQDTVPLLFF